MLKDLTRDKQMEKLAVASTQPEKEKRTMTFDIFNWKSKTFWVGLAMVVAGLAEYLMPGGNIISDMAKQFFGDVSSGMLISNGLAIIFGREAISKASRGPA